MVHKTPSDAMCAYLNVLLREGRHVEFVEALGHFARAHGISSIAESSGLGRESLYKALSRDAKPRFETMCKVLRSMGLTLTIESGPRG
jgi:probable addiction module antidote protein